MLAAMLYLVGHAAYLAFSRRRPSKRTALLGVDALLFGIFAVLVAYGQGRVDEMPSLLRLLRLWSPIVFSWWAYKWTGRVLQVFFKAETTMDARWIRLEGTWFGQPSLRWQSRGGRSATEAVHAFYASYYFYTPVLGITLHLTGQFADFERMSLAVVVGYFLCYLLFPVLPTWGPRWGLARAGLTDSPRPMEGYLITSLMNRVMWGGLAFKGGAMPSAHSSTAVVFWIWCGRIWGLEGAIVGGIVAVGMWIGSIYGRYHYLLDVIAGAAVGLGSVWLADFLYS